jgi:hypothetical protein
MNKLEIRSAKLETSLKLEAPSKKRFDLDKRTLTFAKEVREATELMNILGPIVNVYPTSGFRFVPNFLIRASCLNLSEVSR